MKFNAMIHRYIHAFATTHSVTGGLVFYFALDLVGFPKNEKSAVCLILKKRT